MPERYRVITHHEEDFFERGLGEDSTKLFCRRLNVARVTVGFIAPYTFGEFEFETPVLGFCQRGGTAIFLHAGLGAKDLILTCAHECRHVYQKVTGRHCLDSQGRERDARLFEYEVQLPSGDARELHRWVWRELMFDEEPGLREAYARAESVMQERRSPPIQPKREYASNPRPNTVAA